MPGRWQGVCGARTRRSVRGPSPRDPATRAGAGPGTRRSGKQRGCSAGYGALRGTRSVGGGTHGGGGGMR